MYQTILKVSLVGFAFLICSCSLNGQISQNGTNSNIASNQNSAPVQNGNVQIADSGTKDKTPVDYFAHFKPEHREIVEEWLKSKTFLRPAVEEIDNRMFSEKNYRNKETFQRDYEENIKMVRESVGPNGYQYYAVGDMNGDKKVDFAVLFVDSSSKDTDEFDDFALAIFNAPFKKGQAPAYFEQNLGGVTNSYISYNVMSKNRLFLGKFESDVLCATYYPKGNTYFFEDCM